MRNWPAFSRELPDGTAIGIGTDCTFSETRRALTVTDSIWPEPPSGSGASSSGALPNAGIADAARIAAAVIADVRPNMTLTGGRFPYHEAHANTGWEPASNNYQAYCVDTRLC